MSFLLAKEFYNRFKKEFKDLDSLLKEFDERIEIIIPALCKEIGDLFILAENDEITVGIGEYFHCHFDIYNYNFSAEAPKNLEAISCLIDEVFEYLCDILNNKVVLAITKKGTDYISSYTFHIDDEERTSSIFVRPSGEENEVEETFYYTWKGKYQI
jgi:hypothetical protein